LAISTCFCVTSKPHASPSERPRTGFPAAREATRAGYWCIRYLDALRWCSTKSLQTAGAAAIG